MGPADPIAIQLGPLAIRWYGLLIVVGSIAGGLLSAWQARSRGDDSDHIWNMLPVCLALGLIGARLYHVFSSPAGGPVGWPYYREHPLEIIAFWHGGLQGFGIYGAVLGGAAGLAVYAALARLSLLRWLDYGAVGLILAQAIGRWGNYFNQELYGPPTNFPWGVYIEPQNRLAGLEGYDRFHPVFLYESLLDLAICAVLIWASRRFRGRLRDGDIFFAYIILYALVRFWLEFLRPDAWKLGGIAVAQLVALGSAALSAVIMFLRHRQPA
jgi:phosphatidylglycerol---prolipoprotein diacylglyceryl transferase